jgi:hypothetical protein
VGLFAIITGNITHSGNRHGFNVLNLLFPFRLPSHDAHDFSVPDLPNHPQGIICLPFGTGHPPPEILHTMISHYGFNILSLG